MLLSFAFRTPLFPKIPGLTGIITECRIISNLLSRVRYLGGLFECPQRFESRGRVQPIPLSTHLGSHVESQLDMPSMTFRVLTVDIVLLSCYRKHISGFRS